MRTPWPRHSVFPDVYRAEVQEITRGNYTSPDGKRFKVTPKKEEVKLGCVLGLTALNKGSPASSLLNAFRLESHCVESLSSWRIKRNNSAIHWAVGRGFGRLLYFQRQTFRRHWGVEEVCSLASLNCELISWELPKEVQKNPAIPYVFTVLFKDMSWFL